MQNLGFKVDAFIHRDDYLARNALDFRSDNEPFPEAPFIGGTLEDNPSNPWTLLVCGSFSHFSLKVSKLSVLLVDPTFVLTPLIFSRGTNSLNDLPLYVCSRTTNSGERYAQVELLVVLCSCFFLSCVWLSAFPCVFYLLFKILDCTTFYLIGDSVRWN